MSFGRQYPTPHTRTNQFCQKGGVEAASIVTRENTRILLGLELAAIVLPSEGLQKVTCESLQAAIRALVLTV